MIDVTKILNLSRLPARLNAEQTAPLLGFAPHDIPVLVKAKLLKPLGNPPPNAVKWFSAKEIEECASNPEWLNHATKVVYAYWDKQNKRRRAMTHGASETEQSLPA